MSNIIVNLDKTIKYHNDKIKADDKIEGNSDNPVSPSWSKINGKWVHIGVNIDSDGILKLYLDGSESTFELSVDAPKETK